MRLTYQLDALENAKRHAEIALAEWRKHKLLARVPEPDAHNEDMARFIAELDREIDGANTALTSMQFKFATTPVLRASFFNPANRAASEDRYIIHGPDRDLDEPHIFEETWECIRKYLQGQDCQVDEDWDVYVITRRKPHRIIHIIKSCRGEAR